MNTLRSWFQPFSCVKKAVSSENNNKNDKNRKSELKVLQVWWTIITFRFPCVNFMGFKFRVFEELIRIRANEQNKQMPQSNVSVDQSNKDNMLCFATKRETHARL